MSDFSDAAYGRYPKHLLLLVELLALGAANYFANLGDMLEVVIWLAVFGALVVKNAASKIAYELHTLRYSTDTWWVELKTRIRSYDER